MSCPALLLLTGMVSVSAPIDTDPALSVSQPATVATNGSAPAVAAEGSSFVATWLAPGQDADSSCIMAGHLDASGRRLAEPRVLACVLRAGVQHPDPSRQVQRPWLTASPAIAASTGAALVVWGEGSRLVGAVWRGDAIVRFARELSRQPSHLDVDFDGEAFVLEWSDYDHVFVDRVGLNGRLVTTAPVTVVDRRDSGGIEDSALACAAGTCLVTFEHFYGNSRTTGGGALVTRSGVGQPRSYGGNPFDVGALRVGDGGLVALMNSYGSVVGEPHLGPARGFRVLAAAGERIRNIRGAGGSGNALLVWEREWQRGTASAAQLVPADAGAPTSEPTNLDGAVHPAVATTDVAHFLIMAERHEGQGPPAVVAYAAVVDASKQVRRLQVPPVVTTPPGSPADTAPAAFCVRATDSCWDCATIQFPDEVPGTAKPACNGLTVLTASGDRCARLERQCCQSSACEQPPRSSPCKAECGDSNGDKKNDRCLVPSACQYAKQLEDSLARYRVNRPAALFAALCGPLPASFPDDLASGAETACGPENITWTIPPETMAQGGGGGGPGLCYGVVRVGREGHTVHRCGNYHCQTLRWCDGRERAQFCTVLAGCQDGHVAPTGLTW